MKNSRSIQKVLALVMLMLFAFSITPKKYLHDLVADHTDYCGVHVGAELTITKTGLSCDCQDLVVTTPFLETAIEETCNKADFFNTYISFLPSFQVLSPYTTKDSRGPPAFV